MRTATAEAPAPFPELQAEANQLEARIDDARAAGDTAAWLQLCHRRDIGLPAEMDAARTVWLAQHVKDAWAAVDVAAAAAVRARNARDEARVGDQGADRALRDAMFSRDANLEDRHEARAAAARAHTAHRQRNMEHAATVVSHVEALAVVGRLEDDGAPLLRPRWWMADTVVTNDLAGNDHLAILLRGTPCPRWAEAIIGSHALVREADAPELQPPARFRQTATWESQDSPFDNAVSPPRGGSRPGRLDLIGAR